MNTGLAVAIFMAPTIIALLRGAPRPMVVGLINVIGGATVIGWFIALALGLRRRPAMVPAQGPVINQFFVTGPVDRPERYGQVIDVPGRPDVRWTTKDLL